MKLLKEQDINESSASFEEAAGKIAESCNKFLLNYPNAPKHLIELAMKCMDEFHQCSLGQW